jgi:hypothetical protein
MSFLKSFICAGFEDYRFRLPAGLSAQLRPMLIHTILPFVSLGIIKIPGTMGG